MPIFNQRKAVIHPATHLCRNGIGHPPLRRGDPAFLPAIAVIAAKIIAAVLALLACDRLLVLAPGGRMAFYGPPGEALGYFGLADWADLFQAFDLYPDRDWAGEFASSLAYARYAAAQHRPNRVPRNEHQLASPAPRRRGLRQYATLTRRYARVIATRRAVVAFIAFGVASGSLAQTARSEYRIGFLVPRSAANFKDRLDAFRSGMRDLGYVEGKNLKVEWRFADGHLPKLELLGNDAPYSRPSNTPFAIEVTDLELRLPLLRDDD